MTRIKWALLTALYQLQAWLAAERLEIAAGGLFRRRRVHRFHWRLFR